MCGWEEIVLGLVCSKCVKKGVKAVTSIKDYRDNKKRDKTIKFNKKFVLDLERRIHFLYHLFNSRVEELEMKVSQLDSKFNETHDRISRLEAGLETVVTKIQENTIMMYHIEWFKGVRNAMRKELSLLEHVKKSKINDLLICLKKGGRSLTEDNFESRFKNFNKQQVKKILS